MQPAMRRIRNKVLPWMHYRHYWKLIVSVAVFCIVCTLLLSVCSYVMFTRTTMGEYSRIGEIEIARMNETFNSVIEEALSLANQLISNKDDIYTCLFSTQTDYLARYHANRVLKSALASNRYLTNISLINLRNHSYLHPNTVSDRDVEEIIRINREAGDGFMRIFTYTMATQYGDSNQFLLSVNPRSSSMEESRATIILWIDATRLLNRMLHPDDHDNAIALTNGTTVFARTNALSKIDETELLNSLRNKIKSNSEPFTLYIQGAEYLTFTQSIDMFDWQLVYMYRVNQVPTQSMRVLLVGILGIALFGVAVLIAILYVRHIYEPIGQLMDQIPEKYKEGDQRTDEFGSLFAYYEEMTSANTDLNDTMKNLQGFVKHSYLNQLLLSDQKAGGQMPLVQDIMAGQMGFSRYAVVLFDVWSCDEKEFANRPMLPQTVVIDEIKSHIPVENIIEIFMREEDRCILIAGLHDSFERRDLIARCDEIARRYAGDAALELLICVGENADGYPNVGRSYKSAIQMSEGSFLSGNEKVLCKRINYQPMPGDAVCQQFTQKLIGEIKSASLSGIRGALKQLCTLLKDCSHTDAVDTIQRIMRLVIIRLDKNLNPEQKEKMNTYIRHIHEERYIGEVIEHLSYFFYDYANAMSNKALIEQYNLVEYTKKYASEHYADCNLHIDDLAKELGVSSITLGSLFKYNTGIPFYKYVNDVRLRQSERLLLETDIPIIEISHSVGILNYTYFFTLFKKKHHVSPKIYRENKVV